MTEQATGRVAGLLSGCGSVWLGTRQVAGGPQSDRRAGHRAGHKAAGKVDEGVCTCLVGHVACDWVSGREGREAVTWLDTDQATRRLAGWRTLSGVWFDIWQVSDLTRGR